MMPIIFNKKFSPENSFLFPLCLPFRENQVILKFQQKSITLQNKYSTG